MHLSLQALLTCSFRTNGARVVVKIPLCPNWAQKELKKGFSFFKKPVVFALNDLKRNFELAF